MIEPLQGMPDGTIGFRASGRVTREEYREMLLPAMRAAAEAGDVRMVFAVGLGHPHAWKRTALVTDVDWIAKALHAFA
jgi:hypothetical protein